jgi:uncharacterized repeat protein (TIGR01451 family)
MAVQRFTLFLVVLGLLTAEATVLADDTPTQDRPFLRRLDNFGKSIFGGATKDDSDKSKDGTDEATVIRPAARNSASQPNASVSASVRDSGEDRPQTSSLSSRNARTSASSLSSGSRSPIDNLQRSSIAQAATSQEGLDVPVDRRSAVASVGEAKVSQPAARSTTRLPTRDAAEPAVTSAKKVPAAVSDAELVEKTTPSSNARASADAASPAKSASQPLHARLSGFRQSAFPAAEKSDSEPQAQAATDYAPQIEPIRVEEIPAARQAGPSAPAPKPRPATHPTVARRNTVEQESAGEGGAGPAMESVADKPVAAEPKAGNAGGLLFAKKSAILSVETLGPRKIAVGKESAYEVSIVNSGEVPAEELMVYVSLPGWADVSATEPTVGNAQVAPVGDGGVVQWRVGRLDAKARERIMLRIIPRQSKPFDLAVRWEHKPNASQAMIEVQEPKLELQLEGPREVLYGKQETYRLKIANRGTGSAENTTIMLMPLGTGENVPASYKVGLLKAGEDKALDVQLTARQAGNLTIQLDVTADNNVHAELAEKVFVRRAALSVDVDGPKIQYVGQQTTYTVRVRNPGTATAKKIEFAAVLPIGAKYVSGLESATLDATGGKLAWCLEKLEPSAEQTFTIRCKQGVPGSSKMEIIAAAEDDLSTAAVATTRIDSVANLVMEVKDPVEPVAVGEETNYEVRLRNRGTKEAENVEVFVYFSRGIEPIAAEGAPNRLLPGQVIFMPIPSVAAGAEVTLKMRAKAEVAGNHVFRVETHCKPLGARLVRETTNLFFIDGPNSEQVAKAAPPAAADAPEADPNAQPPADHASQAANPAEPRK